MNLAGVIGLGFVLGLRHATDADHIAAVSAMVSTRRTVKAVAPIGVMWGLGHLVTLMVLGMAVVLLRVAIPPGLDRFAEAAVGCMLVGLGALTLRTPPHAHVHPARPAAVGMVHGLAGSGTLAVLALGAFERPAWALVYLVVFGVGTIAGMLAFTLVMALPLAKAVRFERAHRVIHVVAALASIALGAWILARSLRG